MSYLEWDDSLHPDHARPVIRELFMEVRGHSNSLLILIRSNPDVPRVPADLLADIPTLRQRLAKLMQVLVARHGG